MRGRRVSPKTNADGEIDENFWAQAAAEKTAERSGEGVNEGKFLTSRIFGILKIIFLALADGDDQSIPFNTQFFHDDYDDGDGPGFDDGDDGGGNGSAAPGVDGDEPDLMTTLAGTSRRVRPQYVNYTKKAKRVDVRKLKENIWKGLDIKVQLLKDPDESMVRISGSVPYCTTNDVTDCTPFLFPLRELGRRRQRRERRSDRSNGASSVRFCRVKSAKDVSEG